MNFFGVLYRRHCGRTTSQRLATQICFVSLIFMTLQIMVSHLILEDDVRRYFSDAMNITDHVIYFRERDFRPKAKKVILIWTSMFLKWSLWTPAIDALRHCRHNCSCEMTTDRSRLDEADAILFHCIDLMPWVGLPKYRHPSQVWVVWCAEPPPKIWNSLRGYNLLFNWTMYYRSDSTVFAPYARVRKLEKHEIHNKIPDILKNKSRDIALANSNCFDDAQRYRLFAELQRHLPLDFYGSCGDKECPRDDKSCHRKLLSYKFSLQFENSYCRDYVSEKYYTALFMNQLPIVNWKKGQIVQQVIPHSYINIYDFPNLKAAANYIRQVNTNDSLYLSYFEWRKFYDIHSDGVWQQFCFLCKELHNPNVPAQLIIDLNSWFADDMCHKGSIFTVVGRWWNRALFDIGL